MISRNGVRRTALKEKKVSSLSARMPCKCQAYAPNTVTKLSSQVEKTDRYSPIPQTPILDAAKRPTDYVTAK